MSCSSGRKRTHSFSNCGFGGHGAGGHLPGGATAAGGTAAAAIAAHHRKKRKIMYKRGATTIVPATKFLLGGNIHDPLNLGGLQEEDEEIRSDESDEEPNKPDEFLLGGDINDPLNLKSIAEPETCTRANDDAAIISTDNCEAGSALVEEDATSASVTILTTESCDNPSSTNDHTAATAVNGATKLNAASLPHLNLHSSTEPQSHKFTGTFPNRRAERKDKIVSPVIPQPYRPLKSIPFRHIITPDLGAKVQKTPKFVEKNTRFQYGNYNRYYGYRNSNNGVDLRLEIFEKHRDLFANKDVLDIGCNVGHVSLIVARSFGARSVTGIDIDRYLIDEANRNVRYYVNCPSPYSMESPSTSAASGANKKLDLKYKCYPVSMPILYGPIYDNELKNGPQTYCKTFPKNVRFCHSNYVLESASMLRSETPQYDTILCLSVTKWIHLNWGDDGLKLAFKRMYAQLKPGGILVLEPQSWDSYKRKKTLTETIWRNFQNINLFPHHFDRYLLSSEVGFSRCHTLAVVNHHHKGFRRAIKVFKKPVARSAKPKHVDRHLSDV